MTDEPQDPLLSSLHTSGTEVHYCVFCERKLWWFLHGMEQEHTNDQVALGRHEHKQAYRRRKGEIEIDGHVRIDGIEPGAAKDPEAVVTVHEVKISRGGAKAQRMQLLYYLRVLREKGLPNVRGVLDYPAQRRRVEVRLTPTADVELNVVLQRIEEIREMASPPPVPEPMAVCAKCAYQELCRG